MKAGTSVIFLPCRDIEKTRHFYHEILGLPIEQKQGENLYIFDTGYGYWGFVQYHDGRSPLSGPQPSALESTLVYCGPRAWPANDQSRKFSLR